MAEAFYDPARDGVTFSLLTAFTTCRELAALSLQGWTPKGSTPALTFGTVCHYINQVVYDDLRTKKLVAMPGPKYMMRLLDSLEKEWKKENSGADNDAVQDFEFAMMMASGIMPEYYKYWYQDDFKSILWDELETTYKLPITVTTMKGHKYKTFLRGKMDGVFHFNKDAPTILRLFETKTKGRIDEGVLVDRIPFERQVSIYLSALRRKSKRDPSSILYNIIRRPGLRQGAKESLTMFGERIIEDVKSRPDWYFIRLQMDVDRADLKRADNEINDLISDFILWWHDEIGHYRNTENCETKYGKCPMLPVCARKDYTSLYKRKTVFRELEEGV